jgi:putative Mg2+ transporter-C (MgtC) family protein
MAGVATGVGFLGAGIIWRMQGGPRGLTTAASSWAATAIGVLCGVGVYLAAALGTVLVLFILEVENVPGFSVIRRLRSEDEGPPAPSP